ncbi:MAG: biopolymer transporter ExbD [Hyphomicrobiaceae bacterium]|nr:biopolymer transporter ExbD [Hyphomicrobiaceae bacterium]
MKFHDAPSPPRTITLTPLIDVVFLLLVFFMLASTFLKFASVPLSTAGAGNGQRVQLEKLVLVHVSSGPVFTINGIATPKEGVVTGLDKLKSAGRDRAVLVLRKGATTADLIEALSLARQSRIEHIQVVK